MRAFVLISVQSGAERRVMNELQSYPLVKRTHLLFGEWDILIEVEMGSTEELASFLIDKIRSKPEVKLTSSLVVAGQ